MTNAIWKTGISDDWATPADWTGGLPTAGRDAVINASGTYTVTISSADVAHSLTLDQAGATLQENSGGSLTMAGGLTLDTGTAILNGANNFGGETTLVAGTLELGNAAALGTSGLTINGGTLIGTANETLSNTVATDGSFALAAAHGDTVKLAGQTVFNFHSNDAIDFGQTGDDGVFVWAPLTFGISDSGPFSVNVNAGTLRDGNGSLSDLLGAATGETDVAVGAKIDIRGHAETIRDLVGGGVVTSTLGGGALTIEDGDFSGTIKGAFGLTVSGGLILTNTASQSGGTTIDNGATLFLDGNGWLVGNVTDNGTLDVNRSGSAILTFNSTLSGTGSLHLDAGTVALDGTNTFGGGTIFNGGQLRIGGSAALGTGELTFSSGTLVGTATEALSNQLLINAHAATFLADHGTTMTLNTGAAWSIGPFATSLVFGDSTHSGTIVWDTPAGSVDGGSNIVIANGTLRAGDSNFQTLLGAGSTQIDHGATLDVAGFAGTINNLVGNGTVENTGAATTVTLHNGSFFGNVVGPVTLDVSGHTILGGAAAHFGEIDILENGYLKLKGPASANVVASQGAQIILSQPQHFTGTLGGLEQGVLIRFDGIRADSGDSVSYSGDATGGTLTVSDSHSSDSITLVGDYTEGEFSVKPSGHQNYINIGFTPTPTPAASAHADTFDFSATPVIHAAPEASVTHMHGGHSVNEFAIAHDLTEALHAHDLLLDHFVHGLFAHGHAIPEALA